MTALYVPNAKIAVASSFEGVVNNGKIECTWTSFNADQYSNPGALFGRRLSWPEFQELMSTTPVQAHLALRPLVANASDYQILLRVIEN